MNESKTIREFPRSVRFPIAVWFQGVSEGQPLAVKPSQNSLLGTISGIFVLVSYITITDQGV